jgi:hypothetical protein
VYVKRVRGAFWALAITSVAQAANAEECRPPAPGSWSDPQLEAVHESGMKRLLAAARREDDERRAAEAAQAEALFREVDQRVACLPPNVVALAQSLEQQGLYLQAIEQYRRLLDARSELAQFSIWHKSLSTAETEVTALLRRTATLTLHLKVHDCALDAPSAFLNDEPMRIETSRRINPGEHRVRVDAKGCESFVQVPTAHPGGQLRINVELRSPTVPQNGPAVPIDPAPDKKKWLGLPPWVWISAGSAITAGIGGYLLFRPSAEPPATFNCASTGATIGCASLY